MMNKKYWDLTNRPHTERKLQIIKEYIYPWAAIIFGQWKRYHYKNFRMAYYIDCYAGRGKYHKNNIHDSINGSPLIALECAKFFKEKYNGEVQLKCIFIENNKKYCSDLDNFCKPFRDIVEFKIIPDDFNTKIKNILKEIGTNAALFFIDPGGIKDLDKLSLKTIVNKIGPNDILLNYICGAPRVLGKVKNMILNKEINNHLYKLLDSVACRLGSLDSIIKCMDKKDRDIFKEWAKELLNDTNLKHSSTYRMARPTRNEAVYFLLFASRSPAAKKIINDIFNKKDSINYNGQIKLPYSGTNNFEL